MNTLKLLTITAITIAFSSSAFSKSYDYPSNFDNDRYAEEVCELARKIHKAFDYTDPNQFPNCEEEVIEKLDYNDQDVRKMSPAVLGHIAEPLVQSGFGLFKQAVSKLIRNKYYKNNQ